MLSPGAQGLPHGLLEETGREPYKYQTAGAATIWTDLKGQEHLTYPSPDRSMTDCAYTE